jgi:hypothetical protein
MENIEIRTNIKFVACSFVVWYSYLRSYCGNVASGFTFIIIIFSGCAAQRGLWPPRSRGFLITHNDAPQSVGLLWTSDFTFIREMLLSEWLGKEQR